MADTQPLAGKTEDPTTTTNLPPLPPQRHPSSPREIRNLSILKAAGIESAKDSLIRRIFPPGKKATGVRRYCISMILLLLIDVFIWCLFFGIYNTNVVPVIGLEDKEAYQPQSCVTVAQNIDKTNSLLYDVWRGELTIEYNDTSSSTTRKATIYDTVTGLYGREHVSVDFLDTFPVGKRFTCHVKTVNKYFAAVKPETVYTNVIVTLVVIGLLGVCVFFAIFRAMGSFIKFRRDFIWDSQRQAWIVKKTYQLQ